MWYYEKRLQFPVNIKTTCPKTAQLIISQYGGPDGELAASLRYLSQRYTMPVKSVGGLLTDIGTEEAEKLFISSDLEKLWNRQRICSTAKISIILTRNLINNSWRKNPAKHRL